MKRFALLLLSAVCTAVLHATTYYVAPSGSDDAEGTIDAPFATLRKAQSLVKAGQSNCDGREQYTNMPDYLKIGSTTYNPYSSRLHYAYVAKGTDGTFTGRTFPMSGASQYDNRFAFCDVVNYWIDQSVATDFYAVKCSYGDTALDPSSTKKPTWQASAAWLAEHHAFTSESDMSSNPANSSLCLSLREGLAKTIQYTLSLLKGGYEVKAILWHQGEGDRNASAAYYENFKTMQDVQPARRPPACRRAKDCRGDHRHCPSTAGPTNGVRR